MPRTKLKLPEFRGSKDRVCFKCGGANMTILYCSSCIPVDRNYIAEEHIHVRCGVCKYEQDVMKTLDKNTVDSPRIDLEKDGV